jgi:hypothetical protein
MDKQICNIKLMNNGDIQLKTNRKETPHNRVISMNATSVELIVNGTYLTCIDTEDYLNHSLWATTLTMEHADVRRGVVAIDTGYTHKSVPALIMGTKKGQRVSYRDGNHFNLRKSNLYIVGESKEVEA